MESPSTRTCIASMPPGTAPHASGQAQALNAVMQSVGMPSCACSASQAATALCPGGSGPWHSAAGGLGSVLGASERMSLLGCGAVVRVGEGATAGVALVAAGIGV